MKVTVIIPNYNGKHFLKPCLDSLKKQTMQDFHTLVVDNASSDGSLDFMKEHFPEIEVLHLDQNYGFSAAVNAGIRHAQTPYVILLNNDTTVDPHFTEALLHAIERSPDIFSVSSKMIQMYHPDLIDSAGDLYTLVGWGICRGTGRPIIRKPTRSLPPVPEPQSIEKAHSAVSDILTNPISPIWKTSISAIAHGSTVSKICTVRTLSSIMSEAGQAVPSIIALK